MELPQKLKENIFEDELVIGKIIHKYEQTLDSPKNKFSIIVGFDIDKTSVARVFINSDINISVLNSDELKLLQIDILKKDYSFLEKDYSFINCSKIFESSMEELKQDYLSNSINFFKDNISQELLIKITNKISQAKTIKPVIKKKYQWI